MTSATLAPSMPRSRNSREALSTIRARDRSFSARDTRMSDPFSVRVLTLLMTHVIQMVLNDIQMLERCRWPVNP